MSEDSAAEDQIAAFIDRIKAERTAFGDLSGKVDRNAFVLDRLNRRQDESSIALDRARTAGGILLGIKNNTVRYREKAARRRGSASAAITDIETWMSGEPWAVPSLDPSWLGRVYIFQALDFPGIVKVGFSRQVDVRQRQIESQHRIQLRHVSDFAGTMFDEHLLQHDMRNHSMANEWFDFSGDWLCAVPLAPLFTPERMWLELREAA